MGWPLVLITVGIYHISIVRWSDPYQLIILSDTCSDIISGILTYILAVHLAFYLILEPPFNGQFLRCGSQLLWQLWSLEIPVLIAPSGCFIYTGGCPCPVCSAASSSSRQTYAAKTGPISSPSHPEKWHHEFVTASSTSLPTCWPSNRSCIPTRTRSTGCSLQTSSARSPFLEWSRKHPVGTHIPVGMHY